MRVIFTELAMSEYIAWQTEDKKTLRKINTLIKDIQRNGFSGGIGKPEALKGQGMYSRRIDDYNRLVYACSENSDLEIISCKGHYNKLDG